MATPAVSAANLVFLVSMLFFLLLVRLIAGR
jgi:hypothetical protein